jgi:cytochrome c peroxidase
MDFTAPPVGLIARAKRFAMYVIDGAVQVYAPEVGTGVCDLSGGEALLEQI